MCEYTVIRSNPYFDEYMLTCIRGAVFFRHSVYAVMKYVEKTCFSESITAYW